MKKWMKNIKLIIAVSTMLAMFAIAPVVYGGISWTGIDPILYVNGTKFNVRAELPTEFICSLSGSIAITITVPGDASVDFISESSSDFGDCEVETDTEIVRDYGLKNKILVQAFFPADQSFPVKLKIDRDGAMVAVYEGFSNEVVTGKAVKFNGGTKGVDPVLTNSYDEISYTYTDSHAEISYTYR